MRPSKASREQGLELTTEDVMSDLDPGWLIWRESLIAAQTEASPTNGDEGRGRIYQPSIASTWFSERIASRKGA